MASTAAFAETAALVGDQARACMLMALMDGRALTATELARAASVTPQTASGHLARLRAAGLLAVASQGRHRYHRLASPGVARMIETIMALTEATRTPLPRPLATGPKEAAMRAARTCYDHLAGTLAVGIADAMTAHRHIELSSDGGIVTDQGNAFLRAFGIPPASPAGRRGRVFCRPCLDWSERRPHIAGVLGAALCQRCLDLDWVRRRQGTRALLVTPNGQRGFRETFGLTPT